MDSFITEIEYMNCLSHVHVNRTYNKDKVPKTQFIKYINNPDGPLSKWCIECRNDRAKYSQNKRKHNKTKAENSNMYYCASCNNTINDTDRALNIDGSQAKCCVSCQDTRNNQTKILKSYFYELKIEYIKKYQSSCYLCNYIFIYNNENNLIEIPTNLIEGVRYLEYNNELIIVTDFIKLYQQQLVLDILHFDHLTEQEQRDKKLLKDNEEYLPKKGNVSQMRCESEMRFEASKCQLLCGKCHVTETIRRENGVIYRPPAQLEKITYINELKKGGCVLCHYVNSELPRFFHFDHIDPSTKIDHISVMMLYGKYSINHLINEVKKCRIICLHCHMLHTKNQWNDNVYHTKTDKPIITDYIIPKKQHCVKIKKYDNQNNLIREYGSISEAAKDCKITRDKLYDIIAKKVKHENFIFKREN